MLLRPEKRSIWKLTTSSSSHNIRYNFNYLIYIILYGIYNNYSSTFGITLTNENIKYLTEHEYYFIANFHNSQDILDIMLLEYVSLFKILGYSKVFVSIYENGSKDNTKLRLKQFSDHLTKINVAHQIVLSKMTTWNANKNTTSMSDRIDFMAKIRNAAMLPLYELDYKEIYTYNSQFLQSPKITAQDIKDWILSGGNPEIHSFPKGFHSFGPKLLTRPSLSNKPSVVIFINDVIFTKHDIIKLILTKNGNYDAVCALDFDLVKMYDVWVTRDLNGNLPSAYYPYIEEASGRAAILANQPAKVYSCWNGVVVFPAQNINMGIKFRTWTEGEIRSPNVLTNKLEIYESNDKNPKLCTASECLLFHKDIWEVKQAKAEIYMEPTVKVYYNRETWYIQYFLMPFVNTFGLQYFQYVETPTYDSKLNGPPMTIACGIDKPDLSIYLILVPFVVLFFVIFFSVFLYEIYKVKRSTYGLYDLNSRKEKDRTTCWLWCCFNNKKVHKSI